MSCFFGIIGVAILWPASGYYLLGILGWLGLRTQEKLLSLMIKPNAWLEQKIPYIKYKNIKPISKNFPNIVENTFIKLPLRLIIYLPVSLLILGIGGALAFFSIIGTGSCFQ